MDSAASIANQPPAQVTVTYYHIQSEGTAYRVVKSDYDQKMLQLGLACIAWTGVVLVCAMIMLVDITNSVIPNFQMTCLMPFVGTAMSLLALTAIVLLNRKTLRPTLIFSSLAALTYTATASVLYATNAHYQWIAATAFLSLQIIIGILFFKNKKTLIPLTFLGLQLILVALKLDTIISVPWATLLLLLVTFAVISLLLSIAMLSLGIAQRIRSGRHNLSSIGPIYEALIQLGIVLFISLIVTRLTVLSSSVYLGSVCILYHILFMLIFCNFFKTEIALYLSKAVVLLDEGRKVTFTKVEQQTTLYKLSSNWFALKDKEQKQSQSQTKDAPMTDTLKTSHSDDQCVVCLTEKASLVWMPCGHLTICDNCGTFLMQKSKLKCVICKTDCQSICHIAVKQKPSSNPKEYKSDYCYQTNFQ